MQNLRQARLHMLNIHGTDGGFGESLNREYSIANFVTWPLHCITDSKDYLSWKLLAITVVSMCRTWFLTFFSHSHNCNLTILY